VPFVCSDAQTPPQLGLCALASFAVTVISPCDIAGPHVAPLEPALEISPERLSDEGRLIVGVLNHCFTGLQAKVQALEDQVQALQERLKELEMERAHNTAQLDLLGKCVRVAHETGGSVSRTLTLLILTLTLTLALTLTLTLTLLDFDCSPDPLESQPMLRKSRAEQVRADWAELAICTAGQPRGAAEATQLRAEARELALSNLPRYGAAREHLRTCATLILARCIWLDTLEPGQRGGAILSNVVVTLSTHYAALAFPSLPQQLRDDLAGLLDEVLGSKQQDEDSMPIFPAFTVLGPVCDTF
jgi:hypothetical protein